MRMKNLIQLPNGEFRPTGYRHIDPSTIPEWNEKVLVDHDISRMRAEAPLPISCDNTKFLPPVGDQREMGCCTCFASVYYVFTQAMARKLNWNPSLVEHIFSPAYVYNQIRELPDDDAGGSSYQDAIALMQSMGCASLARMPYNDLDRTYTWPTEHAFKEASYYKISQNVNWFNTTKPNALEGIKQHMASGGIGCGALILYPPFEDTTKYHSIYCLADVTPDMQILGSHATTLCLDKDTAIPTLDGRNDSIEKLVAEFQNGKENWVYSRDENNEIVPGKIIGGSKTGIKKTVKIILDNGKEINCTPDHPIMKKDGSYVEAQNLVSGDSLNPLYTRISEFKEMSGYQMYYDGQTFRYTHSMVANMLFENAKERRQNNLVIHHKDFHKENNYPDNLTMLTDEEHWKLHSDLMKDRIFTPEMRQTSRDTMNRNWKNPVWVEKVTAVLRENVKQKKGAQSESVRAKVKEISAARFKKLLPALVCRKRRV